MSSNRETRVSRDAYAGCFVCHGAEPAWIGGNAQGVAARHHDLTGHETWCTVHMNVRYGRPVDDDRQLDIEATIAGAGEAVPA